VVFWVAAALVAVLSLLFLLDVPVALKALSRAAAAAKQHGVTPNPLVSSGLRRGIGKVALFAVTYVVGYAAMGVAVWRGVRRAMRASAAT
jgi:hypothetical protein